MRRRLFIGLAACLLVFLLALAVWPRLQSQARVLFRRAGGTHTVEDRLAQYAPAARLRMAAFFEARRIPYPPEAATLLGLKHEKTLQVYAAGADGRFHFVRSYPIIAASGKLGPKLREGDRQVPEGVYRVESLHPNSLYHLALRVNYPNPFDQAMGVRDGRTALGGDIMIHGSTGSVGCLAMGDEAAEDLFVLAADTGIEKVKIILAPADLRRNPSPAALPASPEWVQDLYRQIQAELSALPLSQE